VQMNIKPLSKRTTRPRLAAATISTCPNNTTTDATLLDPTRTTYEYPIYFRLADLLDSTSRIHTIREGGGCGKSHLGLLLLELLLLDLGGELLGGLRRHLGLSVGGRGCGGRRGGGGGLAKTLVQTRAVGVGEGALCTYLFRLDRNKHLQLCRFYRPLKSCQLYASGGGRT
jgi:hypothetical protein